MRAQPISHIFIIATRNVLAGGFAVELALHCCRSTRTVFTVIVRAVWRTRTNEPSRTRTHRNFSKRGCDSSTLLSLSLAFHSPTKPRLITHSRTKPDVRLSDESACTHETGHSRRLQTPAVCTGICTRARKRQWGATTIIRNEREYCAQIHMRIAHACVRVCLSFVCAKQSVAYL